MGYIYKITNKINNKLYIGQTKKDSIEKRFQTHIRASRQELNGKRKLTFFHFALIEYGSENFIIEALEECDDSILDEREKYWIEYYSSYMPNGYNMTLGGQGLKETNLISQSKPVYQYSIEGDFIGQYKDSVEASKNVAVSSGSIRSACLGKCKTAGGFKWFREYRGETL